MENMRVSELAKELGLTSKEVIDKFAQLSIIIKSHSNVVSPMQIQRLKDFVADGSKLPSKKPKAFIVKKAKIAEETPVEEKKENHEPENKVENKAEKRETIINSSERPVRINREEQRERPTPSRIEIVKPSAPKNRLDIVRNAPQRQSGTEQRPFQRPQQRRDDFAKPFNKDGRFNSANPDNRRNDQRGEQRNFQRPVQKGEFKKPETSKDGNKPTGFKKPIERHIISQDIYENKGFARKRTDVKKKEKDFISKKEEQERISLEKAAAQKHKKRTQKEEKAELVTKLVVTQAMTISELADKIQKTPADIVKFLMFNGTMATVNQLIDIDVIKKVCAEYELEVLDEDLEAFIEKELEKEEKDKELAKQDKKLLKKRAPVVSIMGHVDHGKTTLLDSIRASKHKIVATEVGGITQSIGAYTVYLENNKDKKIVFVDTPGHEAFTEMRARGAKATDIAILVVAADDGIMPQTIEAIAHAKAAEVPVIVAVNKIDKPGANPDKVLQQLTEHGLVPEEWGGETITVKVSALNGTGVDELLEYILLVADVADLKANPQAPAEGVVIEANLDKGKGPVATLLVQNGTLKVGDCLVVGNSCGKVRALLSDSGERITKAAPSTPVEVLGLTDVPQAGDNFKVVSSDKEMKSIIDSRKVKEREKRLDAMLPAHIRKEAVVGEDNIPQLNLIIKANTHGSAEAVSQAIAQLESREIVTKIIHVGVGDISEADVMLASASGALILGFSVKEDSNAQMSAEKEKVTIKKYDIIYQILEDIEKTMISLLQPEIKEVELGKAEIRQVFTVGKLVKIAGCYVTEGKINRNATVTIKRKDVQVYTGQIDQLKRFKDDVKEVTQGFECGVSFVKFNDIEVGDIIEVSKTEEVERLELDTVSPKN